MKPLPKVGEHSFSNALAEVLAAASKAKPFSVAELHARILNRLKCWTSSFVKDNHGKRKEDPAGKLQYERQPRRTPIYSILCETQPRRSILVAPLKPLNIGPEECSHPSSSSYNGSANITTGGPSPERVVGLENRVKKRKRPVDEVIEYPQVLLAVRLDKHELDLDAWKECLLRQLPPDAKEIKIERIFGSFSTLLLLRMPVAIWDVLPEHAAYSFIGFVITENQAVAKPNPVKLAERFNIQLPYVSDVKLDEFEETAKHLGGALLQISNDQIFKSDVVRAWQHIETIEAEIKHLLGQIMEMERKKKLRDEMEKLKGEISFQANLKSAGNEYTSSASETPVGFSYVEPESTFAPPKAKYEIPTKSIKEADEILGCRESLRAVLAEGKGDEEDSKFSAVYQTPGSNTNTPWCSLPMRALSREETPISPPLSPIYQTSEAPDSPRSMSPEHAYGSTKVADEIKDEPHSHEAFMIPSFHPLPTP